MKFALVDGNKMEAQKGAKGICPSCGSELIAKCGQVKINHWAHKGIRNCDIWWENETEWHRSWKGYFPISWQEVVQFDKNGEKHIADVKTQEDWVLEFQHSYIRTDEMRSRNAFYPKLVWVVDGQRRKSDILQFQKVINEGSIIQIENVSIYRIPFPKESRLLKEWLGCGVPVFFDFHELNYSRLWLLIPRMPDDRAFLIPYSLEDFIELHSNNGFDEFKSLIHEIRDSLVRKENSSSNRLVNNLWYNAYKTPNRGRF